MKTIKVLRQYSYITFTFWHPKIGGDMDSRIMDRTHKIRIPFWMGIYLWGPAALSKQCVSKQYPIYSHRRVSDWLCGSSCPWHSDYIWWYWLSCFPDPMARTFLNPLLEGVGVTKGGALKESVTFVWILTQMNIRINLCQENDTNEYPNIFVCKFLTQTNIRIYSYVNFWCERISK